jgi:hypothetical protein
VSAPYKLNKNIIKQLNSLFNKYFNLPFFLK